MGFLLTSLGFHTPYSLSLHCLEPAMTLSHFSTSYFAHGMLFLSFLASFSPLASLRPIYLFVGPVIHYSCRLGLMDFLLFILSILCSPHYWAFLSAWTSTTRFLIPHSHWLFTNFIGLPRSNNLILIFGVHGPAINPLLS